MDDVERDPLPDEVEEQAAMVERYPLPEGVEDVVVNKRHLAAAFQKSLPTIDQWISEGMPFESKGTNGQAYEFRFSVCYAWQKAREAAEAAEEEKIQKNIRQMQMALLGGGSGSSEMALTPKQRKELYETEAAYNKLAQSRGELIARADVVALLERTFSAVRNAVNGMPDRLSRDVGLDGRQSEAAVVVADDLLAELHRELSEFMQTMSAEENTGQAAMMEAAE
ncbi:DUF1441 family protein [Pseudovibrio brasiliensis]|uniref:DUF1441 family protein n=1 Tax=Pseudovibrio brasiliensis TaxID=1898042 RepID=A0ABX8AMQ8_9HYPH|nr:DUF1441 family protein [Pseudovibrio brasiliensis]QUS54491.1 DUF1441 family protein [Pseudovibrio brasiliensis]